MKKITTLADLDREGFQIWGNCTNEYCGRGRPLDIAMLISRFGGNHSIINDTEITSRLRCECGQKGGVLILRPPNRADAGISLQSRSAVDDD